MNLKIGITPNVSTSDKKYISLPKRKTIAPH
jgi:hypothetical protein